MNENTGSVIIIFLITILFAIGISFIGGKIVQILWNWQFSEVLIMTYWQGFVISVLLSTGKTTIKR